jgi:type I restriction enzyme S subunit
VSELPRGWVRATLGEVAQWGSGGTPRAGDPRYYGGNVPWAVIGDLNDGMVTATAASLTEEGLRVSSARVIAPGTVLMAMYGSIGKLGIAGRPLATNQAIAFARSTAAVEAQFLFWFLRSQREAFAAAGKGATQKNISQTVIRPWPIPVPPLAEQRRIVAAIEEQLSRLDVANAALISAARKLSQLRQGVLDRAGALAIESWGLRAASDVCAAIVNGNTPPADRMTAGDGDVPFIKVYNLTTMGVLDFSKKPTFVDREAHEHRLRRSRLLPGDVLINIVGPPLGKVAVVPSSYPEWNTNQAVVAFRPRQDILRADLLALWLMSRPIIGPLLGTAKATAGQFNLNTSACRRLEVPVPPLDKQRGIVDKIEQDLSITAAIAVAVLRAERRVDALRRAILARAFRGELVPQDPDDESASVVLERIAAQRAAAPKPRRQKKKATTA